jgi:hypothetical protein
MTVATSAIITDDTRSSGKAVPDQDRLADKVSCSSPNDCRQKNAPKGIEEQVSPTLA